jgi:hypothetical protein
LALVQVDFSNSIVEAFWRSAKHRTKCMPGRGMTWSRSWPRPGRRHCRSGWLGTGLRTVRVVPRRHSLNGQLGTSGQQRREGHARGTFDAASAVGPERRIRTSNASRRARPLAGRRCPDVRRPWCRMY